MVFLNDTIPPVDKQLARRGKSGKVLADYTIKGLMLRFCERLPFRHRFIHFRLSSDGAVLESSHHGQLAWWGANNYLYITRSRSYETTHDAVVRMLHWVALQAELPVRIINLPDYGCAVGCVPRRPNHTRLVIPNEAQISTTKHLSDLISIRLGEGVDIYNLRQEVKDETARRIR